MTSDQAIEAIARGRIVAIMRGDFQGRETEIVSVLLAAGITAVEVTLNSADAVGCIRRLAGQFGGRMAVGAGTVMKAEEVDKVADVGASFIVSPNRNVAVIAATKRRDMASIPGCFTPSEIVEAIDAGADAAKLFPASAVGPAFLKALRGPLPKVRIVPTGGVDSQNATGYFAAGAWAIGAGSELINADALKPGGMDRLATRAVAFAAAALPT